MSGARRWGARKLPQFAPGERLLWRGGPRWTAVARHVFFVPLVATYFIGLTLLDMAITRWGGESGLAALRSAVPTVIAGGGCVLILVALAWAVGRTTTYVLTTERVVMQFGVALPATLSIPLHLIEASAARIRRDHTGDISLALREGGRLNFVKLWPHARVWRQLRAEPLLRDIAHVGIVAPLLCRALSECHASRRENAVPTMFAADGMMQAAE